MRKQLFAASLAAAVLSLSVPAEAVIVFSDDLSDPNGTVLNNKAPDVGGSAWTQTTGANVTIVQPPGYVETQGAARVINGFFTSALGPNQVLTVTANTLQSSGSFFSGGFAGYSLLAGAGNERAFFGDVNDGNTWTLAPTSAGGANKAASAVNTLPATAVFTYNYNTGAATLSINGTPAASTTLAAGSAIDRFVIANNGGGDIRFGAISADISAVPEPAAASLIGLGAAGLLARRRRQA